MKTYGTRTLLVFTAILAGLCGLLIPAIQAARNAAMEISCASNLRQVALGLSNYEAAYRQLPIAVETASSGKLWRSWRTHVYPKFMEQMPQVYDASTAWDSITNTRLINGAPIPMAAGKGGGTVMVSLERVPWCFSCPKCKNKNGVNYVVITGDGTLFPDSRSAKLSDVSDGVENTLFVVESVNCTLDWIEPRDLDIKTMEFAINSRVGPSISSHHPGGALVCFADLKVFYMTPSISETELKAMITIDGGESIRRENLVSRGVLIAR